MPRSLTDLYGHLRDFFVVEGDGATVGCGALSIIWENMAEVRSLAVAAHARRKGCGRLIVEACIAEARESLAAGKALHTFEKFVELNS